MSANAALAREKKGIRCKKMQRQKIAERNVERGRYKGNDKMGASQDDVRKFVAHNPTPSPRPPSSPYSENAKAKRK